jgi:hypothetical protein
VLQICADVCTHFLHPQALLHSLSCWQARSTLSWWAAPPAAPVASWAHADAGGWMGVGGWVGRDLLFLAANMLRWCLKRW